MNNPYKIGYQKTPDRPDGLDLQEYKYVFKFDENTEGGKKTIGVNDYPRFLEEVYARQPKNFYQVIRDERPIREYYDIDYQGDFPEDEWFTQTVDFIKNFLYHRNNIDKEINPEKYTTLNKDDFIILTAHKRDKLSFHFYSKKTGFKNISNHKSFSEKLKESIPQIDLSVYSKNRALRLIGNSKFGQDRCLKSWSGSYNIMDTIVELPPKTHFQIIKVNIPPPIKHPESEPLENLEEQQWFQEFLEENREYTFSPKDRKLRRDGSYERTPCLVEPTATHGTDSYFVNRYRGTYYICCPQHKGKYVIPGQTQKISIITPFPTKNYNYYWLDFCSDIKDLNLQGLGKTEYYQKILPKINLVLCYIIDLQCYVIRSSTTEPNQLQKKVPKTPKCFYESEDDGKFGWFPFEIYVLRFFEDQKLINFYESRTFDPNPKFDNPKVLNTWNDFKCTDYPTQKNTHNLNLILYHFREIWCNGNQEHFEWLIYCWFKPFFENPHILTGTAIVLWSEQGAGKNIIIDEFLIPFIFREEQSSSITGITKITQKHNTIIQDKIFCNVNELPRMDLKNRDMFDALKGLLTDKYITIEPKGIAAYKIPNFTRYIFCSNHKESLFIESGDRRFLCLEVSSKHKGDIEYFNNLVKVMNQETANMFFHYCLNYEPQTPNLNVRKIPMTQLKADIILNCSSSPEQFCLETKNYIKIYNETKFEHDTPNQHKYEQLEIPQWMTEIFENRKKDGKIIMKGSDLYHCYKYFCEENGFKPFSISTFGTKAKTILTKTRSNGAKYLLDGTDD